MQQVSDWLEKLGLSEYAQRFAENRIDFSVLPELTDQDLEKIGVVLGDLNAPAAVSAQCSRLRELFGEKWELERELRSIQQS